MTSILEILYYVSKIEEVDLNVDHDGELWTLPFAVFRNILMNPEYGKIHYDTLRTVKEKWQLLAMYANAGDANKMIFDIRQVRLILEHGGVLQ